MKPSAISLQPSALLRIRPGFWLKAVGWGLWAVGSCPLTGCMLFTPADPSYVSDVPEELKATRVHIPAVEDTYTCADPTPLDPGVWATYQVGDRTMTLAVAGEDTEGTWIEVVDEGTPRTVSGRLVLVDGRISRALYRELPSETIYTQPLSQTPAMVQRKEREVFKEQSELRTKIEDREILATVRVVRLEDLDGRRREEQSVWSLDVPALYAGSDLGGLIHRGEVRLLRFGTDWTRLIDPTQSPVEPPPAR